MSSQYRPPNTLSGGAKPLSGLPDPAVPRGHKRPSTDAYAPATSLPKKARKTKADKEKEKKEEEEKEAERKENDTRPLLTMADLEFDHDRSQLRDPRQTPGRERRPRYDEFSMSDEMKEKFKIPGIAEPKRGSKDSDTWFARNALANPAHVFHDLYECHKKGPNGSPTYDSAGFQLDYKKVCAWMKPQAYNKKSMVNGMAKRIEKEEEEEKKMAKIFFIEGEAPGPMITIKEYLKDHVSKDLGIPWHQIDSKKVLEWEEKGFPRVKGSEWWHEPNEVEKKRFKIMLQGASLRKNL